MESKIYKSLENININNTDELKELKELIDNALNNSSNMGVLNKINEIGNKLSDYHNSLYKPNVYNPHRKDFLNDLRFLNKFVKYVDVTQKYFVIYLEPSYHIYELSRYYPNVTFILIQNGNKNIYITDLLDKDLLIKQIDYNNVIYNLDDIEALERLLPTEIRIFSTIEKCSLGLLLTIKDLLPSNANIMFISNIQIPSIDNNNNEDQFQKELRQEYYISQNNDYEYIKFLYEHYTWFNNFGFEGIMLNFRIPYDDPKEITSELLEKLQLNNVGIDFIPGQSLEYVNGELYLEPWSNKTSTNTKIIIEKHEIYEKTIFKLDDYLGFMNYYNTIERFMHKHNKEGKIYGYCECNDCAIEVLILKNYLSNNMDHILKEFNIPKKYDIEEILGFISKRLCNFIYETQDFKTHGNWRK